jgi:hypothetical protein
VDPIGIDALPDGRIVVTIDVSTDPAGARAIVELLERAHAQHVQRTRRPIALALLIVDRLREVLTHADLRTMVASRELDGSDNGTEPRAIERDSPQWCTTQEVAPLLHLTERAVRKRCELGQVPGARRSKTGRGWLLPVAYVAAERKRT